jgi:DNA primase large subunit
MENLILNTLSRFPYLKESTNYIKNQNLSIESILTSLAYRSAWNLGKTRIHEAIENGEIRDHGASTDPEYINELLSYVIARVIVSTLSDKFLVRRYAMAEAIYAYKGLINKDPKFIAFVADQFNIKPVNIAQDGFDVQFFDYLKYSTLIRAPEYKLVNRDVSNGLIWISPRELSRLIQEALRKKINDELPVELDDSLKKRLLPELKEIKSLIQTRKQQYDVKDLGRVSVLSFPPCMKQLLGMTQAGENVPHVGRFALASFLHHIGLSSDQILKLFSTSPDFDVEKARYQVEHITGKLSGTEYTPPSCDTMISNGICYNPDTLCKRSWLTHPLTYYRLKQKNRQRNIGKPSKKKDKAGSRTDESSEQKV